MFTIGALSRLVDTLDASPWGAASGRMGAERPLTMHQLVMRQRQPLYTPEQRHRRDASAWTVVQGVLAPVQFIIFAVSLIFVLRYMATGEGETLATFSVVVKTGVLYTIMVTGAIWEREVFGRYLFAPAFFWEDAVSMVVVALHTAYLAALITGSMTVEHRMMLALVAYATYVFNATQFVLKLRAARRAEVEWMPGAAAGLTS